MCQTRGTIAATMPDSKLAAQRRADRIAAFRAELDELEREGVAALAAEERAAVARHHDALLRELAERYDVDVAEGEKQLSLGMRIASLLGAAALAASAFLLFRRVWGLISTPAQVAVLLAAPLLALLATDYAARRERSGYFAGLFGAVAVACFVLDLTMLGRIFNVAPSYAPFLAWSAFGFLLAYSYGLRLLLAAGAAGFALGWRPGSSPGAARRGRASGSAPRASCRRGRSSSRCRRSCRTGGTRTCGAQLWAPLLVRPPA